MGRLALFDLDNTLLSGDSDHTWGQFMVSKGMVEKEDFAAKNDQFYQDYQNGTLDMMAFNTFMLTPLTQYTNAQLLALHHEFMHAHIIPMILEKGQQLIQEHQQTGDIVVIITATTDFVTAPIAQYLGVEHLIATTADQQGGKYTGMMTGIPCLGEGKIRKLLDWLDTTDYGLHGARFYSDSFNDIPLLTEVDEPVAVDPDDKLRAHAKTAGWPIITLR